MAQSDYLIIDKRILPDYYEKVVETRRLIENGTVREVSAAVRQTGISRSTYYKYKDYIFSPSETGAGRRAVMNMMLTHETGVLSGMLALVSGMGANILTITQSLPINNQASVTISMDVSGLMGSISNLLEKLEAMAGVEQTHLIAME